jgi:nitroreductase
MELMDALFTRRSVRHYTREPIADDQLQKLVEAAAWAPTGGNTQPWAFVIVRSRQNLGRLRAASPGIIGAATAAIAICLDRSRTDSKPGTYGYDCDLLGLGAAMQNLLLAAHEQGLGACAIGSFHVPSIRALLALPEHLEPKLLIALGHAASQPKPPRHRPLTEICFFESAGGTP